MASNIVTSGISITRYTTPTIVITPEVAPASLDKYYLTIKQGDTVIEKTLTDSVLSETTVSTTLDEADTANLSATSGELALYQARYTSYAGVQYATSEYKFEVVDVLKDELIDTEETEEVE